MIVKIKNTFGENIVSFEIEVKSNDTFIQEKCAKRFKEFLTYHKNYEIECEE